jgi:hypothetical protein
MHVIKTNEKWPLKGGNTSIPTHIFFFEICIYRIDDPFNFESEHIIT